MTKILCLLPSAFCLLLTIPSTVLSQTVPAMEGAPPGTDQPISLDLKGVDVIDVLKLLSQKSGLNFVAGRNVTGRVTVFAKEISIWEAFERIVDANELAYERKGSLVTVMMARDYELLYGEKFQERQRNAVVTLKFAKAAPVATALNQIKSAVGRVVVDEASNTILLYDVPTRLEEMKRIAAQLDQPTETRIFTLHYAEAEKLKEKLQEFLTPGVGVSEFDARTNKLVVTDLPPAMRKIDQVVRAFDEQEREVLIEAKIIQVDLSDEESLGVDWQQVFAGADARMRGNFSVLSSPVLGPGATGLGWAFKLATAPKENTQILIEALKKYGRIETVSNPRIAVSNRQEAKILIGTKEAFVTTTTTVPATGSTVAAPEVQFVDVGTKLFVTPNVKGNGQVQLKIRPEVSDVSKTVTDIPNTRIPIVTTTEAETNVLVKSGTTVIIGGLIKTTVNRSKSQIPVLGNLPLVGAAFRNRADISKKTELVVFLTPQIISSSGEPVTTFPPTSPVKVTIGPGGSDGMPVPPEYQTKVRSLLRGAMASRLRSASVGEGSATLSFAVGRDGRLIGNPEITSPQGEAFVQATRAALNSIMPLPPFPEDTQVDQIRFRTTVDYHP